MTISILHIVTKISPYLLIITILKSNSKNLKLKIILFFFSKSVFYKFLIRLMQRKKKLIKQIRYKKKCRIYMFIHLCVSHLTDKTQQTNKQTTHLKIKCNLFLFLVVKFQILTK